MYLAREVMDKEIVDRDGLKAGKVDNLLLEILEKDPPVVRAIVTQHGALARRMGVWAARLSRWFRIRILGMDPDQSPIEIGWDHVTAIDVAVHTDLDRQAAQLMRSENAVWQRLISRLPFVGRHEA